MAKYCYGWEGRPIPRFARTWFLPGRLFIMHLLYLDDAGSVGNRNERHFVIAGVAMFERQAHWLQLELERLAETWADRLGCPGPDRLEFHGNPIRKGDGWWRKLDRSERRRVITETLRAVQSLRGEWELFGVVVDKQALSPDDPIEYAFEQICSRFDQFLARLYRRGNSQRGIIILDKSSQETRLQSLATEFRTLGHRWGVTRNLVDVPLFVDSRATRLIQYADLVSYALWRKFEHNDPEFFAAISRFFDQEGGTVHGLHHYRDPRDLPCDCPGCAPRPF